MAPPLFVILKADLFPLILDHLDAQSIIRLGKTCKDFRAMPEIAWSSNLIFNQFADQGEDLRALFKRAEAIATGGAVVDFFNRNRYQKLLELVILVNEGHFTEMKHFFMDGGYEPIQDSAVPRSTTVIFLQNRRGRYERRVSIRQCHGNSELQAMIMADHTGAAVALSSTRAICMYPLLGLQYRCAYWFGGDYKQTEIFRPVTKHSPPGCDPLAKALRSELGKQRSLGDQQCFIMPPCANWGKKGEWTLQIRVKDVIDCTDTRWGLVHGTWPSLRQIIPIIEHESVKSTPSRQRLLHTTEPEPYRRATTTQAGSSKFENITVARNGRMTDVVCTDTGKHIIVNRGVTVNGNPIPDAEGIHEDILLD